MKKIITILFIALLASCKNASVTDTETKAVDSVLKIYGGKCNSLKGDDSDAPSMFILEMSDSKILEELKKMAELPSSNIAYTFYTNLGQEKSEYTDINVRIKFKDEQTAEFSYPVKDIVEAESLKPVLLSVAEKVRVRDYNGLYNMFDTLSVPGLSADKLQEFCNYYDSTLGPIASTQFVGFSFFNSKDGGNMVHLGGVVNRGNKNTPIAVIADRKSKKVMTLKFEF